MIEERVNLKNRSNWELKEEGVPGKGDVIEQPFFLGSFGRHT